MLGVEDWAEIRRLHRAEGMPIKAIARLLGCLEEHGAAGAGRRWAAAVSSGRGEGSIVDAVEPQIRELLAEWPTMPATVIAERIGWDAVVDGAQGPGARSCGRCICRRTRRRGRRIGRASSPSAICGSRRSTCRSGSGRPDRDQAAGAGDGGGLLAVADARG